jgi:hypothetical protein
MESFTKTATIPSLRVDPEPRHAAENVLREGETLASFVGIDHRRAQQVLIARGLASRDAAQRTGEYFTAEEILRELDEMHATVQAKPGK